MWNYNWQSRETGNIGYTRRWKAKTTICVRHHYVQTTAEIGDIIIPCSTGGGNTVLLLSVLSSVLPSVQDIFRRIFFSNYWWQKSDIWSQASYMYAILWETFLDPSDSYFLFSDLVGFYIHWAYMRGYHKWALAHSWYNWNVKVLNHLTLRRYCNVKCIHRCLWILVALIHCQCLQWKRNLIIFQSNMLSFNLNVTPSVRCVIVNYIITSLYTSVRCCRVTFDGISNDAIIQ